MKAYFKSQFFASFIFGSISALAFAPTNLIFLAVIGFSALFLLIDRETNPKKCFWLGWNFGFGHFLVGLYWISISLLVDIVKFGWLIPFAISLIPAACAVYIALTTFLTKKISSFLQLNKLERIFVFILFWLFFEYLRSILFSGFPWNLIGYSLVSVNSLSQIAAIFGIYGLSFLALLIFTLPALLFEITHYNVRLNENSKNNFYIILALIIIILIISAYGKYRIKSNNLDEVKNGNIRIVQPNIKQKYKWDPEHKYQSFFKNITLANSTNNEDINYVIWSESAIPYAISEESQELLNLIKQAIPQNAFLISGAIRIKYDQKTNIPNIFNSIITINDQGKIIDYYNKRHLVPFGEYIPFQKYLPFISKITNGAQGFASGQDAKTVFLPNNFANFSPLICYEVIFSKLTINKDNPPDFILNLTNDAWFGRSSGPYQHLAMSQIRAIEYGMPLIRAANSGISAYIDPYGRIVDKIDLNETGILDIKLLEKLESTLYAKHGNTVLIAFLLLFISPLILYKFHHVYVQKPNRRASSKKTKINS